MKQHGTRRFSAFLLALLMVLALLPIHSAFAMSIYALFAVGDGDESYTLDVEPSDYIDAVKWKVQAETGLVPEQIALYFGDRLLEDGHTLADYNIQKESTIRIVKLFDVYPVFVGGRRVTSQNANDVLEDGTVRFSITDDGENVLTLDNADIDAFGSYTNVAWTVTANIFCNEPGYGLTINLIGDNKLSGASYAIDLAPTDYNGKVTLTGPGKLTMDAEKFGIVVYGELTLKDTTVTANKSCYAKKSFSIDNCVCTVDVNDNFSYGLYTEQSLNIKDSLVTITTGEHSVIVNDTLNISGNSTFSVTSITSSVLQVENDVNLSGRIALLEPEGGVFVGTLLYESDGTTLASKAVYTSVYNIFVGGEQVTGLHMDGEGWAFTPASDDDPAVLALNNYSYTGEGKPVELVSANSEVFLTSAVLFYDEPEPLEIRLTGENAMHQTSTDPDISQASAIYARSTADDALTIVGTDENASLTLSSGTGSRFSTPVASKGDLIVRNCTLNAGSVASQTHSYGLYAQKDILLEGCTATLKGVDASNASYGVSSADGGITVRDSVVNATGGDAETSAGFYFGVGDIVIDQSTVTAASGAGGSAAYGMRGIDVQITDSVVEAAAGTSGDRSDGIYASGAVDIADTRLSTAAEGGVFSFGIVCFGSGVTLDNVTGTCTGGASSSQSGGLYADHDILIENGCSLELYGKDTSTEYGASTGLISFGSTAIHDSSVLAEAAAGLESYGVCVYDWDYGNERRFDVMNSTVCASADDTLPGAYGIYVDTLTVGDGSILTAEGHRAAALFKDVATGDAIALTDPFGGTYRQDGDFMILLDADGTTEAKKAVFARPYRMWIGDRQVSSANLSSEGWTFTPAVGDGPAVLALNNYSYTGKGVIVNMKADEAAADFLTAAAVHYREEAPLRIEVTGENTVILTDTDELRQAIAILGGGTSEDALTIVGMEEGASLTAKTGSAISLASGITSRGGLTIRNLTVYGETTGTAPYHYGISAEGSLLLDHCDTTAIGGDATSSSYGLYAHYSDLRIDGGKATAIAHEAPFTIGVNSGEGDIYLNDCELSAQGGESPKSSYGIYTYLHNLYVTDSIVESRSDKATSRSDAIYMGDSIEIEGSRVTAIGNNGDYSFGLMAYNGAVSICDSEIYAEGVDAGSQSGGINAMTNLEIDGSTVTAIGRDTSDPYGASIGAVSFGPLSITNGSTVTATSGAGCETYGICAYDWIDGTDAGVLDVQGSALFASSGEGETSCGVYTSTLLIAADASVTAAGQDAAVFGIVKNAVSGTGWADAEGTGAKFGIAPNQAGATLPDYKKVRFGGTFPAPVFRCDDAIAYESWILENGETLYRCDITVSNLIDGAVSANSAQVFLNYDHDAIEFRRGEGPVDWLFFDNDGALSAVWASETGVQLHDDDVLMTLYFAAKDVAPETQVALRFVENAQGLGSALSIDDTGVTTELFAETVNGSIRFGTFVCGDANNDGIVTAADAAAILRAVVGLSVLAPQGMLQADADGDGAVTAVDAVLILRYLIGMIAALPVEAA